MRSQGNLLSPKLKTNWQTYRIATYRKSRFWVNEGRTIWTVTDKMLEARCGQVWVKKKKNKKQVEPIIGGRCNLVSIISRISTWCSQVKSRISCSGDEKELFWRTAEDSFLPNNTCPWEALVPQSSLLGLYQSLAWGKEGNHASSARRCPTSKKKKILRFFIIKSLLFLPHSTAVDDNDPCSPICLGYK